MTTSRALATSGITGRPRTYPILADVGHEATGGGKGRWIPPTNHSQELKFSP
jgi:hypothetical protein